jgi:hypothetical protein
MEHYEALGHSPIQSKFADGWIDGSALTLTYPINRLRDRRELIEVSDGAV